MAMSIYVGNLARTATDDDVTKLFSHHGNVCAVWIIIDRVTGQSRGFGFVEMDSAEDAARAVQALNGTVCDNQRLDVSLLRHHRGTRSSSVGGTLIDERSDASGVNGAAKRPAGKLPPELLEWARQEFTEEEILAGVREIRETGGLELKDFIDEIEDILCSPNE